MRTEEGKKVAQSEDPEHTVEGKWVATLRRKGKVGVARHRN